MNKKLLLLVSLLVFGFVRNAKAQLETPLFTLTYDTICVGSEFTPNVLANNAQTYNWAFCPPILSAPPTATNLGIGSFALSGNTTITSIKVDTFYYTFTANQQGHVFRYQYIDGVEQPPLVTDFGHFQNRTPRNPTGVSVIKDKDGWHLFVIGTTIDGVTPRLVRLDFANGLNYASTGFYSYSIPSITAPHELFMAMVDDSLRGFTFKGGTELVRMDFQTALDSVPTFVNFGNISNAFTKASDIAFVYELGNYHFLVTNESAESNLTHVTFGNSLLNTPFADDLGDLGGELKVPSGITVIKDCNNYHGYVINKNTSEWVKLFWPASIAGTPTASAGTLPQINIPTAMTKAFRKAEGVYAFVVNADNTMTRIKYANCTNANIPGSDQRVPPPIKYDQAGVYNVFLTIDEGLTTERTSCRMIYVKNHPAISMSTQDTAICNGDTVNLRILTFGAREIVWSPNYNIDTLKGRFVKVWPDYNFTYIGAIDYAPNCIVKKEFKIRVDNVNADAGEDRWITDGSTTQLGGPNTTLRDGYTYKWTPPAYFMSSVDSHIALVRPAQNMTYYLTVTSPLSCTDIDSVFVGVPCEDIILPNAFVPTRTTFGLLNLQLTQVNYFKIFDRWGRMVFSTSDPNAKWNGRDMKGVECPLGVYVWEIDAYCKDTNKRFRKSGNVTLLR